MAETESGFHSQVRGNPHSPGNNALHPPSWVVADLTELAQVVLDWTVNGVVTIPDGQQCKVQSNNIIYEWPCYRQQG